jgi:hypothetical protein
MGYAGIRENERDRTESTRGNRAARSDANIGSSSRQRGVPAWIPAEDSSWIIRVMASYPKIPLRRELGRTYDFLRNEKLLSAEQLTS